MHCVYCDKPIENNETIHFRGSQTIHAECNEQLSAELDDFDATKVLTWYRLTLILWAVDDKIETLETQRSKEVRTSGKRACVTSAYLSEYRNLRKELKQLRKTTDARA